MKKRPKVTIILTTRTPTTQTLTLYMSLVNSAPTGFNKRASDLVAVVKSAQPTVVTISGLGFRISGLEGTERAPQRGPQNKDHSILRSILGCSYFGKVPCCYFDRSSL